jgi:Uma2 family endonuclease
MIAGKLHLGPADQGQRVAWEEYLDAEFAPGHLYELGQGVLVVSDIPNRPHATIWEYLRDLFVGYKLQHPREMVSVRGGAEARMLIEASASDRHPDLAVYKTPPTEDGRALWSTWIPDLVVEVVSPGSEERDYVEKRGEYLQFGVREYWIVDPGKKVVLVLQRRGGRWQEQALRLGETYQTHLFPGLTLDVAALFAAGDDATS